MAGGYTAADRARRWKTERDYRGEFGRDRDRILYSSGFRRLGGKTQVVPAGEFGGFHNRMTHSLKVAQVGQRMAQHLSKRNKRRDVPAAELVEAACLAHDLGHPPFGHAGEEALNETVNALVYLREYGLQRKAGTSDPDAHAAAHAAQQAFGGFEGNAQTFRVLVWLSARHPLGTRGLNLTRGTLDATIKYPWLRGESGKAARKWNVYPDDLEYAEWVRDDQGLGESARQSFEAQLMDWADDVSYACHDVEDFFRAGLIPLDELFQYPAVRPGRSLKAYESERTAEFFDWLEDGNWYSTPSWDRDLARSVWNDAGQTLYIDSAFQNIRADKAAVHRASSLLITHFQESVSWEGDAPCRHHGDLMVEPRARFLNLLLQKLNWYFVINRPALASVQIGQQRIVRELLEIYSTCGDSRLLPEDRREEAEERGDTDGLRACIDHVASLTEAGAIALYHRLTGVRVGFHTDAVWRS